MASLSEHKCKCEICLSEKMEESEKSHNELLNRLNRLENDVAKYVYNKTKSDIDKGLMVWKDVKKEQPEDKEKVLAYLDVHECIVAMYYKEENGFLAYSGSPSTYLTLLGVTHWMYLPPDPK